MEKEALPQGQDKLPGNGKHEEKIALEVHPAGEKTSSLTGGEGKNKTARCWISLYQRRLHFSKKKIRYRAIVEDVTQEEFKDIFTGEGLE